MQEENADAMEEDEETEDEKVETAQEPIQIQLYQNIVVILVSFDGEELGFIEVQGMTCWAQPETCLINQIHIFLKYKRNANECNLSVTECKDGN